MPLFSVCGLENSFVLLLVMMMLIMVMIMGKSCCV